MIEETPFNGQVKVITRGYGMPNNDPNAGADGMAPSTARALLLDSPRFVTSGSATFLVGKPWVGWGGSQFQVLADTDMDPNSFDPPEVWISAGEIITIVEEEEIESGTTRVPRISKRNK